MDVVQSSLTSNTCDRQPEVPFLRNMRHIVLVDIDNWKGIFKSDLPFSQRTFVWGFWSGNTSWDPPKGSALFQELENHNCFYLHPKCSGSKDAADFALCAQAYKLDIMLPKSIPFTVLSGDCGFQELQNQLSRCNREIHLVNPHHKTVDTVFALCNSIADK
ncbi:predicted protein [Nematostella vectensis]|uniref:ZNF451 PIN-like domain-containing protein n=1 Tax=Nematostella vectensis TaxID=45351 RepID=A7SY93_NEMVE|nr:E3 SUMO-protein ligase ZNF451 [Nematostella vectensis]XP_048581889.1 E3 SUMO-protein ligase ZNF451 [Nematostella vectensis]EDO31335.1 predicted protein [Nematostella vectensis]|eukprot:XP_001623435.1 predicted protein [Nematostella vectensis]